MTLLLNVLIINRMLFSVGVDAIIVNSLVVNKPRATLLNIPVTFLAAAGSAVPVKPTSESIVPTSVSNMSSLADPSSGPPLLTTSNQTPLSALGHEDTSPSSLIPQHNKYGILFLHYFSFVFLFKRC